VGEELRPALQALYEWGERRAAAAGIEFEPAPKTRT
jgi:DNA-binding HxlR family transcriptional regulator